MIREYGNGAKKTLIIVGAMLTWAGLPSAEGQDQDGRYVVESARLKLVLREDLRGVEKLIDKRTGRDYATNAIRSFGLYRLYYGRSLDKAQESRPSNVASRKVTQLANGVRIQFDQKGPHPALVDCTITANVNEPGIRFGIDVTNRSSQPLVAIDYPQITCQAKLGADSQDDRLLYPQLEGVLLCNPAENLPMGRSVAKSYPGSACAQFIYFYDPEGGWYSAAEDGRGSTKVPLVRRDRDGLFIAWRHEFPSVPLGRTKLAYDVVWSAAGPSWQDGADIYREWAERNAPWCEKTILAGAAPDWLQQANVFLNYQLDLEGEYYGAEEAGTRFQAYRNFFGLPIVACVFGWEKHGAWIGPDYFPPRGGEEYYTDLASRLAERGDHMHLFTSGFRWGVRKTRPAPERANEPVAASRRQPRLYTDYNGLTDFYNKGKAAAVIGTNGRPIRERPAWADNYLLCAGSEHGQQILGDCFATIFDWGIAGVDLDQNLGAGVPHCFSDAHGHPPGAGEWQYRAMYEFLEAVRLQSRENHPDSFVGVEEPCELYIPVIDIVHGRAFTDNVWPAAGPGAVSVPLYTYLYHEYQLTYAGWIDKRFSPRGDMRLGIGRATLFGMQPGVRIGKGEFEYREDEPTVELAMLRDAVQLMQRCRDYLLLGRMLHDPVLTGSPAFDSIESQQRPAPPISWPVVQATAWRSSAGHVCYAVGNLSDTMRKVQLLVQSNGMNSAAVRLTRINATGDRLLRENTALPIYVTVTLGPWEICCIEQRPVD